MPAAYTPQQRAAIQQYVQVTKVKDSVAAKALKAASWDISTALNELCNRHYAKTPKANTANLGPSINAVFDQYRDDPKSNPDGIGVEGSMNFLGAVGVNVEEPASVAVHHLLGAESMGELERAGFVRGWEARAAGSVDAMRGAAAAMRGALSSDPAYFRDVYRHAFLLGRAPGQKSVQLDTALELWRLMFGGGGGGGDGAVNGAAATAAAAAAANAAPMPWKTPSVDWLALWLAFIRDKGPKVVSRDLWNQTEVFARKSIEDESLAFWSEESSWPTVVDEFVAHIKEKGTAMEVE